MKRALLVGINPYKKPHINKLNGCVSDVLNIRDALKTFYGFENSGIRVLTDDRAEKDAILDRLNDLVHGARDGDPIVFHYSGHGSQVRDRDGDELADSMDELICPYDMDWDGTFITDDDLAAILEKLPEGTPMEVLLDCCHSGTGIRKLMGLATLISTRNGAQEEVWGSSQPRYTPPPIDMICRSEGEEKDLSINRLLLTNQYLSKPVLWAGCRSDQTSADAFIEGKYNGAFTFYLCQNIRKAEGKISRAELIKRMREDLKLGSYDQIPQLETKEPGKITGNIFG